MNRDDNRLDLVWRYVEGVASKEEVQTLEQLLREDTIFRHQYLRYLNIDSGINRAPSPDRSAKTIDHLIADKTTSNHTIYSARPRIARLTAALAAGFLVGLIGTSITWAMSQSRMVATLAPVSTLLDGTFESSSGPISSGFPTTIGTWSGDEAVVVKTSAIDGTPPDHRLQFITPKADSATPGGRAIACDVFQIVDLRPWKSERNEHIEATLELSANFFDTRPAGTLPTITFFCQMFLFKGEPTEMHQSWPLHNDEAISTASAFFTSAGGISSNPRQLKTRCLLPQDADFAVVQLTARPNIRPTELTSAYADNVLLNLKTQPTLPVRQAEQ